jgi:holo-[acyl-carrier protein] synthase
MIIGTGVDLIEVARIRSALERFGDRFVERVLHANELAYCRSHRDPGPFLAARFAAKEAVSKAFGTGIGAALGWLDIEVRRRESGEPYVVLHGKGDALLTSRGACALHLSLSHTSQHAVAVAILEAGPRGSPAG